MIGLLLAAGRGQRFGGDKLRAHLADGTPVGLASARLLQPVVDHLLIGVRPDDAALTAMFEREGYRVWPCPQADAGMGHTLAALVRALPEVLPGEDEASVLVALADMPALRPATLWAVADQLRAGRTLVRPSWGGRPGHPVGFAATWRPSLAGLQGDHGARALVAGAGLACHQIECGDPGVLIDIDTPADLQALHDADRASPNAGFSEARPA